MAFVNTRDTIGDQATVDRLVEHSLTELKEDGIGIVGEYACYKNTGLQSVELPSVSRIKTCAFDGCSNLEVVKLGGNAASLSFDNTNYIFAHSKLTHLILDYPSIVESGAYMFSGTNIERGDGAIYVPENLLNSYKTSIMWKKYLFARLQDYPLNVFESISDSWSTILTNPDYATAYAVSNTKIIELTDGTKIKMDLAALNTDIKSDNSGTAKMTWICRRIPMIHRMNATHTASGGWADSEMRSWLISDVLSKIPTEIKSHIVSVKKSYRSKDPNDETLWSDDEIWIPSYKEVGLRDSYYIESDGVVYSELFSSNVARIKYDTSDSARSWFLRSVHGNGIFVTMGTVGTIGTSGAETQEGVVFGFCTD